MAQFCYQTFLKSTPGTVEDITLLSDALGGTFLGHVFVFLFGKQSCKTFLNNFLKAAVGPLVFLAGTLFGDIIVKRSRQVILWCLFVRHFYTLTGLFSKIFIANGDRSRAMFL